jgi:hypothetical protein
MNEHHGWERAVGTGAVDAAENASAAGGDPAVDRLGHCRPALSRCQGQGVVNRALRVDRLIEADRRQRRGCCLPGQESRPHLGVPAWIVTHALHASGKISSAACKASGLGMATLLIGNR